MNPYWRITKATLLGIIIPGGVFAFGYFILGPNMSRFPRLDEKGWQVEVSRLNALPDKKPAPEPKAVSPEAQPTISVVSSKASYRRRRRPTYEIIVPGTLESRPTDTTAEVPAPEAGLSAN